MHPVFFVAPFPKEATMRFARSAARLHGVKLCGIFQELPSGPDRHLFADLAQVADGLSTSQLLSAARYLASRHGKPHRIIGVLEVLQEQIATLREHFGVRGTGISTAALFRDKALMKNRLRDAGLPVARHAILRGEDDARRFAADVGFPMVLKPPAGMGATSTFRVSSLAHLLAVVRGPLTRPWLAEEFLTGDEGSFDTITVGGKIALQSITQYRPTPLAVIENPWIQWCCVLPRSIDGQEFADVRDIGARAIEALGLDCGFTHMEWFRRPDGNVAIGEIAQRPPGAQITRMIGLAYDVNPYHAWARAVIDGVFDGPTTRQYSVGCAFLRGMASGRVSAVTGVERTQELVGSMVVEAMLPSIGAPKSTSYEGDGYAIVRDRETHRVEQALQTIINNIRVHYA